MNSDIYIRILAFLIVSPLLVWGIWVVTVESAPENKSVQRSAGKFYSSRLIRNSKSSELWVRAKNRILISILIFIAIFLLFVNSRYLFFALLMGIASVSYSLFFSGVEVREIKKRQDLIEREFPSVVQIMAVLTSAGMSPVRTIQAIAEASDTNLAAEFEIVVADVRSGSSMISALEGFARRVQTPTARRFAMTISIALDRGSPIANTLIEHSRDITLSSRNKLQREAGKREIALMVPIVFLIMPISVLFALWPSMQNLITLA